MMNSRRPGAREFGKSHRNSIPTDPKNTRFPAVTLREGVCLSQLILLDLEILISIL